MAGQCPTIEHTAMQVAHAASGGGTCAPRSNFL